MRAICSKTPVNRCCNARSTADTPLYAVSTAISKSNSAYRRPNTVSKDKKPAVSELRLGIWGRASWLPLSGYSPACGGNVRKADKRGPSPGGKLSSEARLRGSPIQVARSVAENPPVIFSSLCDSKMPAPFRQGGQGSQPLSKWHKHPQNTRRECARKRAFSPFLSL